MLYLRTCFDRAEAGDLRSRTLKQHREYIASFLTATSGNDGQEGYVP